MKWFFKLETIAETRFWRELSRLEAEDEELPCFKTVIFAPSVSVSDSKKVTIINKHKSYNIIFNLPNTYFSRNSDMHFCCFSTSDAVRSAVFPLLSSSIFDVKEPYVKVSEVSDIGDLCACNSNRSDSEISSKLSVSELLFVVLFLNLRSGKAYAERKYENTFSIDIAKSISTFKTPHQKSER